MQFSCSSLDTPFLLPTNAGCTDGQTASQASWWTAVEFISDLLVLENIESWDENLVVSRLVNGGFSKLATEAALDWLQNASLQGRLQEIIGFIHERNIPRTRIENPSEGAFISNKLWKRLETMRLKGIVNLETVERLLAALRSLDSRDWEEDEVWDFVSQIVHREKFLASTPFDEVDSYSDANIRPYC